MAKGRFDATELIAPLMLRIPLGLIFMAHGSQKLFGLFGGQGLTGTFKTFEEHMGIPPIFTLLAIVAMIRTKRGIYHIPRSIFHKKGILMSVYPSLK